MKYRDRIEMMIEQEMELGNIIIADNIFAEYEKGVSFSDLSIKYKMPIKKVKELIRRFGGIY